MTRLLVIHKGEGRRMAQGKRTSPSYRTVGQVGALVRYALSPARQSQGKERVVGLVDGMCLGLTVGEDLPPEMASFVARQLVDDVPEGRRKIRHVILSFASDLPMKEQAAMLKESCRRFVAKHAPGCTFLAVLHDDHVGEDERGLHAHLIIRNADDAGRALDWSRDNLKEQQSMIWAAELGVVPTRGTGVPRRQNEALPYPKAVNLNAKKLGELNYEQLEELVRTGRLVAGRRNKSGVLTSIVLNGRCIRISTARAIAQRERGLADLRRTGASPDCASTGHRLIAGMAITASQLETNHTTGRSHPARSFGLGFGFGPAALARTRGRKRQRDTRALRGVARGMKAALSTLSEVDKIGRVLR